jgi:hypothetical protein
MHTDLDLAAAQLALLAVRASVRPTLPTRELALRVASSDEFMDSVDLAKRLAAMEKPLHCSAREARGIIEITYAPLAPGTQDSDWHAMTIQHSERHGGFLSFPRKAGAIDPDKTMVLCFGRDEAILLTLSAVELWHRQYSVANIQYWGDHIYNPRCSDWPQFIDARRRGALGILSFFSSSENPDLAGGPLGMGPLKKA